MKKYKIEVELAEDGNLRFDCENDGFTAFELVGLLAWKKQDIENQIFSGIKPDVISRKVIAD